MEKQETLNLVSLDGTLPPSERWPGDSISELEENSVGDRELAEMSAFAERTGWVSDLVQAAGAELFTVAGRAVTPLNLAVTLLLVLAVWCTNAWLRRACENKLLSKLGPAPRYTLIKLSGYMVWIFGIAAILRLWGIDLTGLAVVAGVLGVGIGFGLQSLAANFVAGLVLLFERPVEVHDFVSTEEVDGRIHEVGFRATTVITNDNIAIIVPNAQFINEPVTNWSHGDSRVRLVVPVTVAYGSDVEAVSEALVEVAHRTDGVMRKPRPRVRFKGFGDSALELELLAWTDDPIRHQGLRSRLNFGIDAAFRERSILIPFPQRDVHLQMPEGLGGLQVALVDEASPAAQN